MFFDSHNRVARLYPALITVAPIIWSAASAAPTLVPDIPKGAAALAVLGCLLYLLACLARSRGKVMEQRLIDAWGAWPTTILLRHRDPTIDGITKARYHAILSALCDGVKFPAAAEEQQSPCDADVIYRSATKRLIEARRGQQYQMLHNENASYGFRRNLLGLKPVAVTFGVAAAALTTFAWWLTMPTTITWPTIVASFKNYPALPVLLALDVGYFLLLALLIRPGFVYQAAREYAEALFRTLDTPAA